MTTYPEGCRSGSCEVHTKEIKSNRAWREECEALRAELNSIKHEAETNQKWAFLEWRQLAEERGVQIKQLEQEVQKLRSKRK